MKVKVDINRGCEDNKRIADAGIEITDFDLQNRANQNCSLENEGRLFASANRKKKVLFTDQAHRAATSRDQWLKHMSRMRVYLVQPITYFLEY
ncbi:MAG: hypothetical protein AB7U64_03725 [Blastocatellales bacterium]